MMSVEGTAGTETSSDVTVVTTEVSSGERVEYQEFTNCYLGHGTFLT